MRRSVTLALLVLLTLPACAFRTERIGSDSLLEPLSWAPGETTAEQISRHLGPPHEIQPDGDGFRFVYRFERRLQTTFVLSYVLRLFTRESRVSTARTLVVSFDASNRLRGHLLLAPLIPN